MLDQQDQSILQARQASFTAIAEPKQGDFIRFANGTIKRIAHVWADENGKAETIQPTMYRGDSSFYLGDGYMSFSGSLNTGIPAAKFHRTSETMPGSAWFFHHDYATAHNGVNVTVNCPVWECELPA